ncbi:MAG: Gfo/Idh/MocA family oxidoreductase [Clostridia bacterium]|nr:Gfo/Idh/MocA family oxidoreductase [Clostridia bacterium]
MIKIAIIGVGNIAQYHLDAYQKNENAEIYALCDLDNEKLKKAGEKYGVTRLYTDMHEMLALPEIDAVSVCTWNSQHAPCTIAALRAGKHVLCEKPMAKTAEEAMEMEKAAREAGKLLMIGFVRRFGNDCRVLCDFVHTDFFGELYYGKATYLRRDGNPGGWFSNREISGGGPLIDLGVHVIDFVRYVMGNPRVVSVYGATFQKLLDRPNIKSPKFYQGSFAGEKVCDVEDLASAMIRFENGAVLSVETSFSLNIKENKGEIELFGTKGGAKISPALELFTEMNDYLVNVDFDQPTALTFDGLFENEIAHFVDCIQHGTACKSPAVDGVEIMKILSAIYESAQTGHEVILEG